MDSVPTGCGTGRLLKHGCLRAKVFRAKDTALASEILREDINQRQLRRQKTAANASCYEAQNTASRVINGASGTDWSVK